MTLTEQQKNHLAELLLLQTGGQWRVDLITDGSELLAVAELKDSKCTLVLARSGATYFNGKLLASSDRFNDILSAWVCGQIVEQPRFVCRGRTA